MASKKRNHYAGALATILLMWAVVAWMIESRASILRDGYEIVLKTEPIDPRDFLRGRYVRLAFAISSVEMPNFKETFPAETVWDHVGTPIYVSLREDTDGRHVFDDFAFEKPQDGPFITGKLTSPAVSNGEGGYDSVRVEYGIERFYASETLAPDLEKRMRDGQITDVVVAVDADGKAQIRALRQGEQIFFTEALY